MHGITHVAGGPDPVPGLLPGTGSFLERILDFPSLTGYWPFDDPSGDAHDESVYDQPLHPVGTPTYGQPGPLTDSAQTSILVEGGHGFGSGTDDAFTGTYTSLGLGGGDVTVMFYIYPTSYPPFLLGGITQAGGSAGSGHYAQLRADGTVMWSVAATQQAQTAVAVPLVEWTHVACTRDSTGLYIYFNGVLVATQTTEAVHGTTPFTVGHSTDASGYTYSYLGRVAHVALFNEALTQSEIEGIHAGGVDISAGDVLQVGPDGVPVWDAPPVPEVTVNGKEPKAAETPKPPPPAPPPPDTDPVDVLMIDQPFTYNGGTFVVQPKTWTTIPFTTPLMERMSDKTGLTEWAEIPISDPDAGGWLHNDFPHGITIPHDVTFSGLEAVVQICLRIDYPIVEGTTSHRALRVLETTHMKTLLLVESEMADGATAEGGIVNVFRGGPVDLFAEGDTGGLDTGGHDDIFFAPNAGLAFYPIGEDWLPDGGHTLKKGMRLVAQCWHDASVPLTFSTVPGTRYKPHFVLNATADTSWGPPWSTWL
jgi:hypothetical protein